MAVARRRISVVLHKSQVSNYIATSLANSYKSCYNACLQLALSLATVMTLIISTDLWYYVLSDTRRYVYVSRLHVFIGLCCLIKFYSDVILTFETSIMLNENNNHILKLIFYAN